MYIFLGGIVMGFSLKNVFKKDEETLVVDRRNQAIK